MDENAPQNPTPHRDDSAVEQQDQAQCRTRDWLTESIVAPPREKPKAIASAKPAWRDAPATVPMLHGLRWFWDVARFMVKDGASWWDPALVLVVYPALVLVVYGPLVALVLCVLLSAIPPQWKPLALCVIMGLYCAFAGCWVACSLHCAIQDGDAEAADAAVSHAFQPGPLRTRLLVLGLLVLAPLWYASSSLVDALCRHFALSGMTYAVCLCLGWFSPLLYGSFFASAFALAYAHESVGSGRIYWAGIKNWRAFLVCGLLLSLYYPGVLDLLNALLAWLAQLTRDLRGLYVRLLRLGLIVSASALLVLPLPFLAYCAARDIFYEEVPPPDDGA